MHRVYSNIEVSLVHDKQPILEIKYIHEPIASHDLEGLYSRDSENHYHPPAGVTKMQRGVQDRRGGTPL
jgi:hypothetical protein